MKGGVQAEIILQLKPHQFRLEFVPLSINLKKGDKNVQEVIPLFSNPRLGCPADHHGVRHPAATAGSMLPRRSLLPRWLPASAATSTPTSAYNA